MSLNSLKWAAVICFVVAMVILLGGGVAMRKQLPPYPGKVVDTAGHILFGRRYRPRLQQSGAMKLPKTPARAGIRDPRQHHGPSDRNVDRHSDRQ